MVHRIKVRVGCKMGANFVFLFALGVETTTRNTETFSIVKSPSFPVSAVVESGALLPPAGQRRHLLQPNIYAVLA